METTHAEKLFITSGRGMRHCKQYKNTRRLCRKVKGNPEELVGHVCRACKIISVPPRRPLLRLSLRVCVDVRARTWGSVGLKIQPSPFSRLGLIDPKTQWKEGGNISISTEGRGLGAAEWGTRLLLEASFFHLFWTHCTRVFIYFFICDVGLCNCPF